MTFRDTFPRLRSGRRVHHRPRTRLLVEPLEDRLLLAVAVGVDAAANVHPINPHIYGVNAGDTATLGDANLTFNRAGGNLYTTYNWQQDSFNHAQDFFWESIGEGGPPSGVADSFFSTTRAAGADPTLTVPTLGWISKLGPGGSKLASFSIAKYGPQQASDQQFFPDAGNGVQPGGDPNSGPFIVGNDPNDANLPSDPAFQQGYVQHLVGRFGTANNGGVRYYTLDNEPGIWQGTHRDVHPNGAPMQEVLDDLANYGAMVKSVDPAAQTLGPEEWGYLGYLYSGKDKQVIDQTNSLANLPDRTAHGGMDYIPFLLDQLAKKQAATGQRLLDVLTVHFYPQAGQDSTDVSQAMQLLRNRSTRSLWDPNYVDESYLRDLPAPDNRVELVPRLKNWIQTYYPGTQTGLTEYDWGAENHMNGATTEADLLGIFGREGLDIATRYAEASSGGPANGSGGPTPGSAVTNGFKMYRNYDGQKSTFGDTSVRATVPNPDELSAFASRRSSDGALTVMVVNKSLYDPNNPGARTDVALNVSNFAGSGNAEVWQLLAPNPNDLTTTAIQHQPDAAFAGNSLTLSVPMQSVTLFVIHPAAPAAPAPTVAGLSPATGPAAGGTSVTITGTNFTGVTAVSFGGIAAAGFTVNSPTQITAVTPAHAAGTVDLTVTTAAGTSPLGGQDQYVFAAPPPAPSAPEVTGLSPTSGPADGGTRVVLTGTNFTGTTAVSFGGTPAFNFVVNSATQITATAPAHAAGTVNVIVTNAAGASAMNPTDQYTYTAPTPPGPGAPAVTGVAPTAGPADGGAQVVITGAGFNGATAVSFGGTPAINFIVNSATQITATAPPHGTGTVDVTVTTPSGASGPSSADQFQYTPPLASGELAFSSTAYEVREGAAAAVITVTRANGSAHTVSVSFTTADGTATPGVRFTAVSGTLTFGPGETSKTFSVPILDDNAVEGNETVALVLQNPSGGATLGSPSAAVLTIQDNDGTPEQRFIAQDYYDLLGRRVDPAGLGFWSGMFAAGLNRTQVARLITSSGEYHARQVQALYQQYLHRAADPAGLNYFVALLGLGLTPEQVATILTGSAEYVVNRGGGTIPGFLQALYQDGLGRSVDAAGMSFFGGALQLGAQPEQVAQVILGSPEYHADVVRGLYLPLLHRAADDGGLQFFVGAYQFGARDEDIVAVLLGSDEYLGQL